MLRDSYLTWNYNFPFDFAGDLSEQDAGWSLSTSGVGQQSTLPALQVIRLFLFTLKFYNSKKK